MSTLWIVSPVYNEEKSLRSFVVEWVPVFRRAAGKNFVFCLINDGSTDKSLEIMEDLAKNYRELMIIDKPNAGHGPTCLLGYNTALESGAAWVFQIDSDGQCDPSDFDDFWRARSRGPVHYGNRRGREDGHGRRIVSKVLALLLFLLSFRWVRDPNVPYRLMSREALRIALKDLPAGFRLANVLLSLLHTENLGIEWHIIRFKKRPGRQSPVKVGFFVNEAATFLSDYFLWVLKNVRANPLEAMMRVGKPLLGYCATYYIIIFPILAFLRAGIFTEYGWLESVHMTQVHRFLTGQQLYTAPSLEYTPVLYGPLYIYVSAVFAFLFGESYAVLRFVSLAATLGTQVMIWLLVWRMSRSRNAAWVAAGLYGGMYGVVHFFFDTARIDSLSIFFVVVMAYHIWRAHEKGGTATVYATQAAVSAVLTKQTTLVPVFALSFWCLSAGGPRGRLTGALCLGSVLLSQAIPVLATDGWFFYYLYKVPLAHPILFTNVRKFLCSELLPHLSFGFALSLWALIVLFRKSQERRKALFCLFFFVAMTAAGLAPRFKIGGNVNNLIPFSVALAFCCGLITGLSQNRKGWSSALVFLFLLCFATQIFYSPKKAIPSRLAPMKMQMRVEVFRHLEGPIFAPCDPYVPTLAGKNDSAFWGAIFDVWLNPGKTSDQFRENFRKALEEKRFRTIVLKNNFFMKDRFPYRQLEANYKAVDHPEGEGMPSGWEKTFSLPLTVYVPRTGDDVKRDR